MGDKKEYFKKLNIEDPEKFMESYDKLIKLLMRKYKVDEPEVALDIFVEELREMSEYAMKRYDLPSGEALARFRVEMRETSEKILNLEEENEDLKILTRLLYPKPRFNA